MNEIQKIETKVENGGATPQGRVSASEFNILVDAAKRFDVAKYGAARITEEGKLQFFADAASMISYEADPTGNAGLLLKSLTLPTPASVDISGKLDKEEFYRYFEEVNIGTAEAPVYATRSKRGLFSDSFLSAMGLNPGTGGGEGGATALSELTDVSLGPLSAGQLLMYNGSKWTNVAQSSIVPTLKSLTFGSKTYNGSTAQTITAADLGALTSHQPIFSLSFAEGAFTEKTYTPNTGVATVNIPTKVSHLSNDSGFATHLGISGNQIGTYANGVLGNLITVPYAMNAAKLNDIDAYRYFREQRGNIDSADLNEFVMRNSGTYQVLYPGYSEGLAYFLGAGSSSSLEIRFNWQGNLFARFSVDSKSYSTDWKQFAFTDSNVASASKLETARTIWGQPFDGTTPISGNLTNVGSVSATGQFLSTANGPLDVSGYRILAGGVDFTIGSNTATGGPYIWCGSPHALRIATNGQIRMYISSDGKIGMGGNAAPAYPLDVSGVIHSTEGIFSDGYMSAMGINTASDQRLKRRMEDVALTVKDVAEAPVYRFAWLNGGGIDVGSTAQYWGALVPELTHRLADGIHLGLDYGKTAVVGLVPVAKATLANTRDIADHDLQLKDHASRIVALENTVLSLNRQLQTN